MIKLVKLQINNFKGINSKLDIEFEDYENSKVNVLSGPNGFGKTTIFEVIEICLTGRLERVAKFENVQKKNTNKIKPYYQNIDGNDVILKLWLKKGEDDFIIIKHYDDAKAPKMVKQGRENIPSDSSNFFKTYLTNEEVYFSNDNFEGLEEVGQTRIDKIFYSENSGIQIQSIYYLFNYIQQEDSIYFLRQTEDDKGEFLSFLFNIESDTAKRDELNKLKTSLAAKNASLVDEINRYKDSFYNGDIPPFRKLFNNKAFDFDSEVPFTNASTAQEKLIQFEDRLLNLIKFKEQFSYLEFAKSENHKVITNEVIENIQLLKAFVLKNIFSIQLVDSILRDNDKIQKGNDFKKANDKTVINKEYFDLFSSNSEYLSYQQLYDEVKQIDVELGEIGKIISDLNLSREKCVLEFEKIKSLSIIEDTDCPLCDSHFNTFDQLIEAIAKKSEKLAAHNTDKLNQKKSLIQNIYEIAKNLEASINLYLSTNKEVEKELIISLRNFPNYEKRIEQLILLYPALASSEAMSYYIANFPVSNAEIEERSKLFKEFIINSILPAYAFNEGLLLNKNLFTEYFDNRNELLENISIEEIRSKIDYLRYAYYSIANERLQFLNGRLEKLRKIQNLINDVYEKVNQTIKDHKIEMIEKIKIPFYVYSGKILQSYQQGLGIFVEIHPTGLSNNVRFKIGNSSDHDVVYHLSSGQMAVVSLAFCLALNKVYNTNENFKFLAIDDPIQTMDDLNIHTFIELLRNEFNDYQIIMSTHDDFVSKYMKYKFDKFEMTTKIQNVQQLVIQQTT